VNPFFTLVVNSAITRSVSGTRDDHGIASSLIPAFDDQEGVFARAFAILRDAIAQHAFPAASVAVTHKSRLIALKAFGHFVYETDLGMPQLAGVARGGSFEVTPSAIFDLASVTKVVATTTMAMILYERGLLELEAPIVGTVPEFAAGSSDPRHYEVTFRMLLAHSSGLPAYEKLFLKAHTRDELLHAAFNMPLTANPGSRAEYSDIGFIVLGTALERLAGEGLDTFCRREVFGPLAMTHTTFNPPADLRPQIPPTADERTGFRKRIIQGEVQDENAYVLGGVAPQAGLFSTTEDVARFAHAMMQCGAGSRFDILRAETVGLFTRRESAPTGTSRALGWDTPSSPSQSGKYFGPHSFGHLGYTGTSLWIDPKRQLSIALLTNRTWPNCASQAIKQVRPRVHDALVEALFPDEI
jgi:CubicO group peptidase (beta-lactamase class C family)